MTMVCGLDLHRRQITFDAQDLESGQVWTGRVWQPDRERFRRWLRDDVSEHAHGGPVAIAVEGCTGWRYVVEEVVAAGFEAHLAEPADTQAARGRKRHAKTDRSDCRLLRELLPMAGCRRRGSRRRSCWSGANGPGCTRRWSINARRGCNASTPSCYQHGVTLPETSIRSAKTRQLLEDDGLEISPAGRQRVLTAYRMIDAITVESRPLKADLQRFGRRQPGCRALIEHQYGIGGLLAVTLWSELGDCQRFTRSEQVVRHSGLDVTVDQSDRRRAGGFISRQGPQTLRWALYEAAKNASHHRSPDHDYYTDVKDHLNGKLATISMARKLDGPSHGGRPGRRRGAGRRQPSVHQLVEPQRGVRRSARRSDQWRPYRADRRCPAGTGSGRRAGCRHEPRRLCRRLAAGQLAHLLHADHQWPGWRPPPLSTRATPLSRPPHRARPWRWPLPPGCSA